MPIPRASLFNYFIFFLYKRFVLWRFFCRSVSFFMANFILDLNQKTKLIIYPILYWLIFFITPIFVSYIYRNDKSAINVSGVMMFFVVFVAPFFYFIPYKIALLENKKQKMLFILLGLILPYFILILFLCYKVIENFNNSKFPF